jgi:hypothetical protein
MRRLTANRTTLAFIAKVLRLPISDRPPPTTSLVDNLVNALPTVSEKMADFRHFL